MKRTTARRLTPSLLLAGSLLGLSPAANAAPPVVGDPPENFSADLPAGLGCPDFDLRIEADGSNVTVRTFVDRKGKTLRTLQAGRGYTLTYTNLDSGKSITIRPTGSNRSTVTNPDGTFTVTETGTAGIILFPTDNPQGPSSTQYYGRIVYTLKADKSTLTSLTTSGTSIDICAALA
jgi:hypothetical protein